MAYFTDPTISVTAHFQLGPTALIEIIAKKTMVKKGPVLCLSQSKEGNMNLPPIVTTDST